MKKYPLHTARRARRGFTLIELLVVISIISVLMALLLPAIGGARARARQVQCASQLRQVAMAINSFATAKNGQYPQLYHATDLVVVSVAGGTTWTAAGTGLPLANEVPLSWPMQLFPYIDNAGAYESYQRTGGISGDLGFKIFTCPEDSNNYNLPGGLSYVANSGLWDYTNSAPVSGGYSQFAWTKNWNGDATTGYADTYDRDVYRCTGVIVPPSPTSSGGDGFVMTQDRVLDGASQTLLLSENMNGRRWYSPDVRDTGFLVDQGVYGNISGALSNSNLPLMPTYFSATNAASYLPNYNRGTARGASPAPSALHQGGVNAAFCDGHVQLISDRITAEVYVSLMSAYGNRYGQSPIGDNSY